MATVKSHVKAVLCRLEIENVRVNGSKKSGLCYYAVGKTLFSEDEVETILKLDKTKRKLPSEAQLHNINQILMSDDVGQSRLRAFVGFASDPSRSVIILGMV